METVIPVSYTHLDVYKRQFVIEGTDIRGNKRKYEDSVVFMQDAYQVDGNGYAFLEVTISNIPLGTYQVYEKPVLRYYLKKAQANTSNVEIIKGREPAYGVVPVDIAYGTVSLDQDHQKASITSVSYTHLDVYKRQFLKDAK